MEKFGKEDLASLWRPTDEATKFGAGQVTIVGGSSLFHGAPILALTAASRLTSMVYFCTPEADREVAERLKASLASFIWVPFDELPEYLAKSDAVLIGPGMMRNRKEGVGLAVDDAGRLSREITLSVTKRFPEKRMVVDGGALQVLSPAELPKGAVITPNRKEFAMLFGEELGEDLTDTIEKLKKAAREHGVTIAHKAATGVVTDGERVLVIEGGNPGLIKGGVGDVVAGLTVGLLAKNEPLLAAASAIYLSKRAAERLAEQVDFMFNADDLAEEVGRVYKDELARSRLRL